MLAILRGTHTFFEMLGNFSFGDYFKEQAIVNAWNLLTKEWALLPERLTITTYHDDDEAFDLWRKVSGLPEHRIIRIATDDNFWSMGDTGPCGPCSEIFYDHGDHIAGGPPGSPDEDGDRFVEIWNFVFMQFDQQEGGKRIDLPRPSIDTGMGLERVAAVMQGVHNNYDIDVFRHLIAASQQITGTAAGDEEIASHRVIADHLRSTAFLLADGVLPASEGRGYVLRRIMRRAMRHAHLLGVSEPLLHRLIPALVTEMGQAFPELSRGQALITDVLQREEMQFRKTLDKGLKLLDDATVGMGEGDQLDGATAFKLYDTYGFPYDLTEDALRTRGLTVERAGFDTAMAEQKDAARAAWKGSGETASDDIWFDIVERVGATEFTGYSAASGEAEVVALSVTVRKLTARPLDRASRSLRTRHRFTGKAADKWAIAAAYGLRPVSISVSAIQRSRSGDFMHMTAKFWMGLSALAILFIWRLMKTVVRASVPITRPRILSMLRCGAVWAIT